MNHTSSTVTSNTSNNVTPDVTLRPDYLSSFMLAQQIAKAINQPNEINTIFQSIPDRQRQDIMPDDFVQYIRLLRRMADNPISLLTRINDQELKPLLANLRYAANLKHEGFYFESNPIPNNEPGAPVKELIYFQQIADDGTPYLDNMPIARVLSLQNYAALYFDAIDQGNREALAVLIRSSADSPAVRLEKADRILAFYKSRIATSSSGFRVSMVMPDRITFEQQVYADETGEILDAGSMTIYADGETGFIIDDKIPDTIQEDDLKITSNGQQVFDFSKQENGKMQTVTSSLLGEIAGPQTLHDDTTCTELPNGEEHVIANYNGIVVEGVGRCDSHQFWRVQVRKLTITVPQFVTRSGLGIGQSLDTLLLEHPFIDETAGVVTGKVGNHNVSITFQVENKIISKITLAFEIE
ncbi:MAG: hypothetical protein GX749_03130 [Ruminococcaceae bacterium]|nr:hypothetical protein [Oscillospiraceae bacterium]